MNRIKNGKDLIEELFKSVKQAGRYARMGETASDAARVLDATQIKLVKEGTPLKGSTVTIPFMCAGGREGTPLEGVDFVYEVRIRAVEKDGFNEQEYDKVQFDPGTGEAVRLIDVDDVLEPGGEDDCDCENCVERRRRAAERKS